MSFDLNFKCYFSWKLSILLVSNRNVWIFREAHEKGKVLIIGGGIANFTNVAATFKGIVRALEEYQTLIRNQNIKIFVRRAGPNYQEGLR